MTPAWQELRVGSAVVRFTNRHGGVSQGPFGSLNLGLGQGDDPEAVAINRARAAAGCPNPVPVGMRQVHGTGVRVVTEGDPVEAGEADALVTRSPGLALLAVTADCMPIVLSGRAAIAVVHAGWRGLAAGVIQEAFDTLAPPRGEAVRAAIGPCAASCCYEVSEEVLAAFGGAAKVNGRMLDLPGTARALLLDLGVEEVSMPSACTICDPDRNYFSHRREGTPTGRQGVLAWLNN